MRGDIFVSISLVCSIYCIQLGQAESELKMNAVRDILTMLELPLRASFKDNYFY